MPKRTDLKSILVIGAGPIIIGQACEFDYSGVQAIKALKDEGYRVILVNSNPATIMTDPDMADATYVEPITPYFVEKIIEREKPDAILPTMGGQTALNCALDLYKDGILEKYGVELIGARADAIEMAEDRRLFREAMDRIGLENPRAAIVAAPEIKNEAGKVIGYDRIGGLQQAMDVLEEVGLPAIIRPAYTLGGTGGGVAYNIEEYEEIVRSGLAASPVAQVLIDESLLGWKEFEMEVVRDKADNCIIICSIENIDPMGVHTGDSITVAPALTLTDKEYQHMRNASIAVLREIGVETGGSNVQFAVNPDNGRLVVIEMNPRVSRSSALASKATGFPIAKIAAKLAVGYTLDELDNDITGVTPASFEPTIDYVVTKIPRFAFEKYRGSEPFLTTAMKSVGEAMAIGRNFQESVQKALCSLETGLSGFDEPEVTGTEALHSALARPTPDRLLHVAQALREGFTVEDIYRITGIDRWFLRQIAAIIETEAHLRRDGLPEDRYSLTELKSSGFSDARLAKLTGRSEAAVRTARHQAGVRPVYKRIDTCAAEFAAKTPYLYSTYEHPPFGKTEADDEANVSDRNKAIILGGGPNRIGQGIEFDYCCCHAAFAMEEIGIESIMVNCNPETVSTDYDTSDRLYFEPLTEEHVTEIIAKEQGKGKLEGVIVQFGGQTPLKLATPLHDAGVPILGTSPVSIDLAEDRERFAALLDRLDIKQAPSATVRSEEEALEVAGKLGYPIMLRPSFVLGGRAMEICRDDADVKAFAKEAMKVSGDQSLFLDRYLSDAIEVDVDALCDETNVHVAGIMEHIEEAGVHSGDSACALPPYTLSQDVIQRLSDSAAALARELKVRGLINIQFAVKDDEIFVLEANPRASRTVPFVAKAVGAPIAKIAAKVMAGASLTDFDLSKAKPRRVAVKEAVFPFARFPGVDPALGPEMRSTGEVMGWDDDFGAAFLKSQIAVDVYLPREGSVFISVKDSDKPLVLEPARELIEMGFKLIATSGTATYLEGQGLPVERINKVIEGQPHVVDRMINGQVQLVFNTTEGAQSLKDSASIRRTALTRKIPYFTTLAASRASVQGIRTLRERELDVRPLQQA
ncbi:MAG: carbamoyl phosphate synthase large subunit [Henriciella sp.]|jgi:carbamoyl-phosphate synthase large subunit|uniref:carbamoyl-phosphate synthase large subunit n=1 Tax=Henriciella sp. TaxID=1968823 RepID=UPI000C11D5DE|nr:carbamoyl-phosphate synthase large subunit [Henriciella sp.]MAN74297.1 carbamoyl phosphate synthase large subunit [Henriciella sp.]PHR83174.1 MAG: carbamoyl phosphate synthase large subunit [Henriciella sp.]|tara:strand:+ start:13766 stop:17044 length:3279 start_codon:yes stop_codon:yes gene_type:complete